jgi:transposase
MLSISPAVRIYLAAEPVDMRKGFNGLTGIVENLLEEDVFSGNLFVFVSKRGDRVKVLTWDRGGFVLFYKRLEKGKFKLPKVGTACTSLELESAQLSMLLEGIDYSRVRTPIRWEPKKNVKNVDLGSTK